MSTDIIAMDSNMKLPAHLQALSGQDDWTSGTTAGFPIISTNGKNFTIKRGDDLELVMNPKDPESAATRLNVIVLKTHPGVCKTYYASKYEPGSVDKPDCYSLNGVEPASDAENRQAKTCAACKQNQWGSRITDSGKEAKNCSDIKRLAVAPGGQINDPMLLRIPPTSLRSWDQYVDMLKKRNLSPTQVITEVSFDTKVSHQLLLFKPVGFVTAEQVPEIEAELRGHKLEAIIGSIQESSQRVDASPAEAATPKPKRAAKTQPVEEEEEEDADEEEAAPVVEKPKKRKPKPAPAPVVDDEGDDDDGDEGADSDDETVSKADALSGLDDLDFSDLDFSDDED